MTTIRKVQTFINGYLRRILKIHWPNTISNTDLWGENKPSASRRRDQKTKTTVDRAHPEEVTIKHHPPGPDLESSG